MSDLTKRVDYPCFDDFRLALQAEPIWFKLDREFDPDWPPDLVQRLRIHRCEGAWASTIGNLSPADLAILSRSSCAAFLNHGRTLLERFDRLGAGEALAKHGIRTFARAGGREPLSARAPLAAPVGSLEFLVSDVGRLLRRRALTASNIHRESTGVRPRGCAVVVLDLIQDFEVLRPLINRLGADDSPLSTTVAVSQRVLDSPLWGQIGPYLDSRGLTHFRPIGPADVCAALGSSSSLLLTASESSANGHRFNHTVCRAAPSRTLKLTVQHGLECVGLRHHRAHDIEFPDDVRFASDVVLTWAHPDELPSMHPAEQDKCIAVGVCKGIAEEASAAAEAAWLEPEAPAMRQHTSVLIAENLHSVRFKDPSRYRRFKRFIEAACSSREGISVTIRSHPGKRTLESQQSSLGYRFLEGLIKATDLKQFDRFVSPPSTIVLDAVLCHLPTHVWTDDITGTEASHYGGLTSISDFEAMLTKPTASLTESLAWAARQTTSFNGAPAAWDLLCHLMD